MILLTNAQTIQLSLLGYTEIDKTIYFKTFSFDTETKATDSKENEQIVASHNKRFFVLTPKSVDNGSN